MELNCKYSVFFYTKNICRETIDEIYQFIKKGIKVYFLTSQPKEALSNFIGKNEITKIEELKQNYLLSIYNDIELSVEEDLYIYDGKMDEFIETELEDTSFNIEQYKIEHSTIDNHIIVKAGAGTGKTKVMIDRILYLKHMDKEVGFENFVMITFTNKATMQMKEKLNHRLEVYYRATLNPKYLEWIDELSKIRIQTIHGFAKSVLTILGHDIGISKSISLRNFKYEKVKIIEELIDKYSNQHKEKYDKFKLIPQHILIRAVLKINNFLNNRGIILEEDNSNFGSDDYEFNDFLRFLLVNMQNELNEIKFKQAGLEISDLIKKLKELKDVSSVEDKLQISYIMVDEFQDTDLIQVEFLLWLIEKTKCISFVVGDIKQSIYRFRGADYTAFEQFRDSLKLLVKEENIFQISLSKNYRSEMKLINDINKFFGNITDCALDRNNQLKYFKFDKDDVLKHVKEDSVNIGITYFQKDTVIGKTEYIAKLIKDIRGYENESIAILLRSNNDVRTIVDELEEKGISCKKEISGEFYRGIAVREFYMLIRALIYIDVALEQYAFINSSYGEDILNIDIFKNFANNSDFLKKIIEETKTYSKIKNYHKKLQSEPVLKVLNDIIEDFKPHMSYSRKPLLEHCNHEDFDKDKAIKAAGTNAINYEMNLNHLMYILRKSFPDSEATLLDIEKFLKLMIQSNNEEDEKMLSEKEGSYDAVCMTVHKAKGLEFDYIILPITEHNFIQRSNDINVFLKQTGNKYNVGYNVDFEDFKIRNDIFLDNISDENSEIIAEEARLFYVALTRGKKAVYIHEKSFNQDNGRIRNWMQLAARGKQNV